VKKRNGEEREKYRFTQSVDLCVILLAVTLRMIQFRISKLLCQLLKKIRCYLQIVKLVLLPTITFPNSSLPHEINASSMLYPPEFGRPGSLESPLRHLPMV
jgi:hypothetical protein